MLFVHAFLEVIFILLMALSLCTLCLLIKCFVPFPAMQFCFVHVLLHELIMMSLPAMSLCTLFLSSS